MIQSKNVKEYIKLITPLHTYIVDFINSWHFLIKKIHSWHFACHFSYFYPQVPLIKLFSLIFSHLFTYILTQIPLIIIFIFINNDIWGKKNHISNIIIRINMQIKILNLAPKFLIPKFHEMHQWYSSIEHGANVILPLNLLWSILAYVI